MRGFHDAGRGLPDTPDDSSQYGRRGRPATSEYLSECRRHCAGAHTARTDAYRVAQERIEEASHLLAREETLLGTLRRAREGAVDAMRELITEYKGWTAIKGRPAPPSVRRSVPLAAAPDRQVRAVFHRTFSASIDELILDARARRTAYACALGLRTDYGLRPVDDERFPLSAWLEQLAAAERRLRAQATRECTERIDEFYIDELAERLAIMAEAITEEAVTEGE